MSNGRLTPCRSVVVVPRTVERQLTVNVEREILSRHFSPMGPEKTALFGIKRFE